MTSAFTTNLHFELPEFDTTTWHDAVNGNFTTIDQLFALYGINFGGTWANATAYVAGQRIIDGTTSIVYVCQVNHTSAGTGTFAADRVANPTYWNPLVTALPTPLVALDYVRVKTDASGYELRTPAQVLADISAFSTSGGTISGATTITNDLTLNSAAAGTSRYMRWAVGGLNRWIFQKDNVAEAGANAGSGLGLFSYDDAGSFLKTIFQVVRATGRLVLSQRVDMPLGTLNEASALMPHGVAPTTPVNGEMWSQSTGWYARISGVTYDLWTDLTVHAATAKTIQVDADELLLMDSAASFVKKKITWANFKATIASYIVGLANTFTAVQTIQLAASAVNLQITTVDPGVNGTIIDQYHDSASPALGDIVGYLRWFGRSSTAVKRNLANILLQYNDPTNAAETAQFVFQTSQAGTLTNRLSLGLGLFGTGTIDKGSGTANFLDYYRAGTKIPFSAAYESAAQTITSAGTLTLAHGLGVQPKLYLAFIKCTTAANGYSIGDEICVGGSLTVGTNQNCVVVPDATNLNVKFGAGANAFLGIDKSTGGNAAFTNANFALILRAWA